MIGKSQNSVDNYVNRGMPGYTSSKERGTREASVELNEAVPWLLDWVRDELDRARTRLADGQTERTHLEVRKLKGELIAKADVLEVWGRLAGAFRSRLLAMPSKLARVLVGIHEPNVIRDKIEAEALQCLAELSDAGAFAHAADRPADPKADRAAAKANGKPVGRRESPAVP